MAFDYRLHDRQADTGSLVIVSVVRALEHLEDAYSMLTLMPLSLTTH
jgi:hypothetical protein